MMVRLDWSGMIECVTTRQMSIQCSVCGWLFSFPKGTSVSTVSRTEVRHLETHEERSASTDSYV